MPATLRGLLELRALLDSVPVARYGRDISELLPIPSLTSRVMEGVDPGPSAGLLLVDVDPSAAYDVVLSRRPLNMPVNTESISSRTGFSDT